MADISNIVGEVVALPGVGEAYRSAVTSDLKGYMARVLLRYAWKFNMKEGSHTTTTANEYTLKGGSENADEDCGVIDSIKLGTSYDYLDYITPRLFDLKKYGEYGLGDIWYYTIRKTDSQRYPIVEFLGSMISGQTLYYYYRKKVPSDISNLYPNEFDDLWRNHLLWKWDHDAERARNAYLERKSALNDLRRTWVDISVVPPMPQQLTNRQMEKARWANQKYLR